MPWCHARRLVTATALLVATAGWSGCQVLTGFSSTPSADAADDHPVIDGAADAADLGADTRDLGADAREVGGDTGDLGPDTEADIGDLGPDTSPDLGPDTGVDLFVDVTPPTVTSTHPVGGAAAVSPDTPIVVTFSEPIQGAATAYARVRALGVELPSSYHVAGNTLMVTPERPLPLDVLVTVSVAGFEDLAGNAMAQSYAFAFTVRAGAWQAPRTISTLTNTWLLPRAAIDSAGRALVVWEADEAAATTAYHEIYASWTAHACSGWCAATRLDDGVYTGESHHVQLAYRPSGDAAAVWIQRQTPGGDSEVVAAAFSGGTWQGPAKVVDPPTLGDVKPQTARVAVGSAHTVAFWHEAAGVKANHKTGGGWQVPQDFAATTSSHQATALAADGQGNVVALWIDGHGQPPAKIRASRSSDGGATWSTPVLVAQGDSGHMPWYPALVIDADGSAHAVWRWQLGLPGGDVQIAYAVWRLSNDSWDPPVEIDQPTLYDDAYYHPTVAAPSAAMAPDGSLVVAWRAVTQAVPPTYEVIRASRCTYDAPPCDAATISDAAGEAAGAAVGVDALGRATVAWYQHAGDWPTPSEIYVASDDGAGAWSAPKRVSNSQSGNAYRPSIAVNGSGRAIAAWDHADTSDASVIRVALFK